MEDDFYRIVGKCVTEWAIIEGKLFIITARLIHGRPDPAAEGHTARPASAYGLPEQIAAIIFYRTPGLDGRIKLVDELLKAVFTNTTGHASLIEDWKKIEKALQKEKEIRNLIAHQPARLGGTDAPSVFLRQRYEVHRGKKHELNELGEKDLEDHLLRLGRIIKGISILMNEVRAALPANSIA